MESYQFRYARASHKRPGRRKFRLFLALLGCLLVVMPSSFYAYLALHKPLPALTVAVNQLEPVAAQTINLPWPSNGQAAVGSLSEGLLAQSDLSEVSAPTASIAKVITSLAVLEKYPITDGGQGPTLTLGQSDVDLYNHYVAIGGSNARVEAGEQITLYQALTALLLPSANNMADSLAIWAFGSMEAYQSYANTMVRQWGLTKTTVSDASGFSPDTVSTASELVKIGQKALQNPVIAAITQLKQADIPVAGTVTNTNRLLGSDGIIGIKTGHTDEAGGCLLFAAVLAIGSTHNTTIIGAIQGATDPSAAFAATRILLTEAGKGFGVITIASAGQQAGTITAPWGQSTAVAVQQNVTAYGWKGSKYQPTATIHSVRAPQANGQTVGDLAVTVGGIKYSSPLVTKTAITDASKLWRLRHYF